MHYSAGTAMSGRTQSAISAFLSAILLLAMIWGVFGGITHAFKRHSIGEGIAAVFVRPWAWYRSLEFFWHQEARWSKSERSEVSHFTVSLHEENNARQLLFKGPEPTTEAIKVDITPEEFTQVLAYHRAALNRAQNVSDRVLDKLHPELRPHYRYEFQHGIDLQLTGIENRDAQKQALGQMLMDKWIDWINPHEDELNKAIGNALGSSPRSP